MKVYTKKGDKGTTGLIGGARVSKGALQIESYGNVDELNSFVGVLRDQKEAQSHAKEFINVQNTLFVIGSMLAEQEGGSKMELPIVKEEDVTFLENWIDDLDGQLEPMRFFVLPGGNQAMSFAHVARCVCRRAERSCVALSEQQHVDVILLKYLNRLSDLLFVYSRWIAKEFNVEETPWQP